MKKKHTIIIPLGKNSDSTIVNDLNKIKHRVHVIVQRGDNPSKNRNLGVKKSRTPFVAFLNGHSTVHDDWLDNVISFFDKYQEVDILGGPQMNSRDEPLFGRASGYAMSAPFGAGGIWRRYSGNKIYLSADETMLTSANLICKKHVFKKINFDTGLYPGEDPKFIADAKKANFKVAYSPDIIVFNKRRKNFSSLSKQVFDYALARTKKESFIETAKKPFFLVPSTFVLYLISLIFFHTQLYLTPLYLYFVLLVLHSLYLPLKNKDPLAVFVLPIIFPLIHLSYGFGMIKGWIKRIW